MRWKAAAQQHGEADERPIDGTAFIKDRHLSPINSRALQSDCTAGAEPLLRDVVAVQALPAHRVRVRFHNGVEGIVNVADLAHRSVRAT
jgi:hypothetical protein